MTGRHFKVKTDQWSVKHTSKIKNDKILHWRMKLSCYNFDIQYQPGQEGTSSDIFSWFYCGAVCYGWESLIDPQVLYHPWVKRLHHFVKVKKMPYSVQDVCQVIKFYRVWVECKPNFHRPEDTHLIKPTQPFEYGF